MKLAKLTKLQGVVNSGREKLMAYQWNMPMDLEDRILPNEM